MKKKIIILIFSILIGLRSYGQLDSTDNKLKLSAYVETYFVYDFANPQDHNRPDFIYSFHRHNEINLNLGFVQAEYAHQKVRSKLALMAGTYANANLAGEPGVLKNIFEANVGLKLSKTKDLWFDMGIFASHIGFESAIGINCWNLTRSILADNSPYYLSGAKLSYKSDNAKWFLCGLVLNGWQRIERIPGNNSPAFGLQATWTPSEKITLNSSWYIGNELPDSIRQIRYFHNFYGQLLLNEKIGVIVGFDFGAQQKSKASSEYNIWYSPVLIARYSLTKKLSIAGRAEYYSDANQVIISTALANGFSTVAGSMNLDAQVMKNICWRWEARFFNSLNGNLFIDRNGNASSRNYSVTTALSISL